MKSIPKPGEFYLDGENRLYQIVTVAVHEVSKEIYVVYQQLYGDYAVRLLSLSQFKAGKSKRQEIDLQFTRTEETFREEPPRTPASTAVLQSSAGERGENACPGKINSEKNEGAAPRLVDFLDAESYASKLEILRMMRDSVTQSELDGIYEALDIERGGDSLAEQADVLEKYMEMQARYEGKRLRS